MDDIQPNGHGEDARLMKPLGGAIARSELDFVVRAVVVVSCGAALSVFGVVQFRIQMPTKPNEPFERRMESIQKEMSNTNDQQGFPRDSKDKKTSSINNDVRQTYPRVFGFIQRLVIRLQNEVAEQVNQ